MYLKPVARFIVQIQIQKKRHIVHIMWEKKSKQNAECISLLKKNITYEYGHLSDRLQELLTHVIFQ